MAGASQLLTAAHHLHGWPKLSLSLSSLISNPGPKSGLVPLGSLIREVMNHGGGRRHCRGFDGLLGLRGFCLVFLDGAQP
uniref:Uncharacterized protein n=1 Tax=Fagus sylvatica TaxID=28930 RepID=A0A2N9GNM7_FAGSY